MNIDDSVRLELLLTTLQALSEKYRQPVIVTAHPRLRDKLRRKVLADNPLIIFHDPFSFVEYNSLQINARVVLSDSGSVSEESAILGFPAITIRDSMERPEALESGSIIMSGLSSERVLEAISFIEASGSSLNPPLEYFFSDSSRRVANFILSTVHQHEFWSGIRTTGNS